nr:hypothetical protein [uncultured Carboxylicivirga sp.]
MKVFGTIKQLFPVNAFTPVIFINQIGNYFIQMEEDGKVKSFKSIKIKDDEILKSECEIVSRIGNSIIYCYTQENNGVNFGTLNSLKNILFELLNGDSINSVAKTIISSQYKIHNKTVQFIKSSNIEFEKENLNCKLHIGNYIKVHEYPEKDLKTFFDSFSHLRKYITKKSNIEWDDFIDITETKFYVNNYKLEIDELFNKFNENHDNINIKKRLINTIIQRVINRNLNRNVLVNNRSLFHFLLSSPDRITSFDKVSFTNDVPTNIKYKSEFYYENKYIDKDGESVTTDEKELDKVLQQANKIKLAFLNQSNEE